MSVTTVFDSIECDDSWPMIDGSVHRRVVVSIGKWSDCTRYKRHDPEYLEYMAWLYRRIGLNRHCREVIWSELPRDRMVFQWIEDRKEN